jgi:hypothetical protein
MGAGAMKLASGAAAGEVQVTHGHDMAEIRDSRRGDGETTIRVRASSKAAANDLQAGTVGTHERAGGDFFLSWFSCEDAGLL